MRIARNLVALGLVLGGILFFSNFAKANRVELVTKPDSDCPAPTVIERVVEKPVIQERVIEKPVVQERIVEKIVEKPVVQEKIVEKVVDNGGKKPSNHLRFLYGAFSTDFKTKYVEGDEKENGEKKERRTQVTLPGEDEILYGAGYDHLGDIFTAGFSYQRNKAKSFEVYNISVGINW